MQKKGYLVLGLLVVILFSFVSSLDSNALRDQVNSIEDKVDSATSKVDTTKETITNQEVRDAYLKKQWVSILENKPIFKQIIDGYRKISPYTNPTLEYVIGMVPALSLFFVLVLVIWFFLVKYYFTSYEVLRDMSAFSKWTSLALSLCFFVILVVLQFFQNISLFLANKIVSLTEFLTSPIMKVFAFILFVVGIIFLSKFSKEILVFARYIRMRNYKRKKESEERDRNARQERATENIEKISKAMIED